jgi:hypothetical protein
MFLSLWPIKTHGEQTQKPLGWKGFCLLTMKYLFSCFILAKFIEDCLNIGYRYVRSRGARLNCFPVWNCSCHSVFHAVTYFTSEPRPLIYPQYAREISATEPGSPKTRTDSESPDHLRLSFYGVYERSGSVSYVEKKRRAQAGCCSWSVSEERESKLLATK